MDTRPKIHKATSCKSTVATVDTMSRSTAVSHPPNLHSANTRLVQTMHSSQKGGARPKVEEKPTCTGMHHLGRGPDKVSPREGCDCSSLAESQSGTITRSYEIRHIRHLNFIMKSSLLQNIEREFNVHTSIQKHQYCIDIKGSDENVKLALKRIEDIGKSIFVDSISIDRERAVSYFKEGSGDEYLASVERSFDVLHEKEISYSSYPTTVRKKVSDENIVWTCLGRKLILEKNNINEVKSSVKVIPVVKNKSGKVFSKNENIVEMEVGWEPTPNLERLVTELLKKASEDRKNMVALHLSPVGNWTFDKVMRGFVDCFIQWLFSQKSTSLLLSVLLFTENVDYYDKAKNYVQDCILDVLNGKNRPSRTKIHLVQGQLDETQADVLVNTTEPHLDLTYGGVSAAILKAAGDGLQQECRHKYPTGITKDMVAATGGHGLKCTQLFHITLPLYRDGMESIENIRNAMSMCLQKASDKGYESIAFPAIGTGRLRYPAEIVLSEMYGGVERFIQDCPDTLLRSVIFVIFPKDVNLFKKFERQHGKITNQVQTKCTVDINIIGMQEYVQLAKEMIQLKEKEPMITLNDIISRVIPAVSMTDFSVLIRFFRTELDLFAKDAVKINHDKIKNELEICGTIAKSGVAFLEVKRFLRRVQEMPKCELSINYWNGKLLCDLNNIQDVCIVRNDQVPGIFVFAKSKDIIDNIKANLQQQRESSTSAMIEMMEKSDLSGRDEEEMDTSGNGIMFSKTEPNVTKTAISRKFSWSKDSEHIDIYETGNLVIKVYKANIFRIPVDAIVNAPNPGHYHEGDSAVAAGLPPIYSVASTTNVHRSGSVEIRAVWPCWSADTRRSKEGLKQYFDALKQTVIKCFLTADNSQLGSIGLQFENLDVCAVQYARAVIEYNSKKKTLREIHIVDDNLSNVDIVHTTFRAMIREGKQSPFPLSIYLQLSPIENSDKAVKPNIKYENKEKSCSNSNPGTAAATYRSDKNRLVCTFPPSHDVLIYDGDITQLENISAVVCSESDKGEAKGNISKALLDRGGQRYAQSKAIQFQPRRKMGDVVVTEGGGNNFEWVIHAIVSRRNGKLLTEIYKNIFREATVRELRSVALPLLEAGGLKLDDTTKILFTELNRAINERNGKGFTLHLVLNDPAISYEVREVFKRCIDEMNGGPFLEKETTLQENINNGQQTNQAAIMDDCVICMDKVTNAKALRCGHVFCKDCIDGYFRVKKVCPTCGKVCGEVTGDQPDGTMDIAKRNTNLTGFEHCKTITISYRFGDGNQGPDHPRPGTPFKGISRTAYLPDNQEGREVCAMLKIAFQRRLVFTIGTSRTTGREGVITWNDIHHKTDPRPNTQFGYPDKTYLQRVRDELAVKGVTEQDVEKLFLRELEKTNFRQTFTTDKYVTYL